MKQFEYKVESISKGRSFVVENALNKLGEDGWELVGMTKEYAENVTFYIFKREKQK